MAPSRKEERRVLEAVDKFIQAAMAITLLEDTGREAEIAKARQTLQELRELVLPFLEGRTDLVTEMLQQLVMQRLPAAKVLEGFGDFKDIVEELLAGTAAEHPDAALTGGEAPEAGGESGAGGMAGEPSVLQKPGEDPGTQAGDLAPGGGGGEAWAAAGVAKGAHRESSPAGVGDGARPGPASEDPVIRSLRQVFPDERVVKNYVLRGVTLSYYLPGQDLAVEIAGEKDRDAERKAYLCRQQGIRLVTVSRRQAAYWRELGRCIQRARNEGQSS
ncbi:MAG: hypothetical protein D9V47_13945 [Clostridia bacterium]|nr:MAG: hypothetical protein D9V47_13945 [Clostridia bacterium]